MPAPILATLAAALLAAAPEVPADEAAAAASPGAPAEAAAGQPAGAEEQPADAAPARARPYLIERVRLEGLVHTRPSEVRRHLGIVEGQLLDDHAVLLSRLRLLQLGWFSRVETRVERGSERGLVVLVFEFTERNTIVVSDFFLGGTPAQPLYAGAGLAEGNWLGYGLGLTGAFVYGGTPPGRPDDPARFSVRGAFFDPELELGDVRLVGGLTGLYLRGEEYTCTAPDCWAFSGHFADAPRLRYERLGGELSFGFRPATFERLLAGVRVERLEAEALPAADPALQGPVPSIHPGRSWLTALTAVYDRDTRNDLFLPTDGSRIALNLTLGTGALGGDYEYSRYLLQLESDHTLPWDGHALKLQAWLGAALGDVPFFERFYAADFAYFSVGPALGRALDLNFSTDSRYDLYLALLGAEYEVPLWSGGKFFYRGYLAAGVRWLYTGAQARADRTAVSSTPLSGDLALRLDTPIGTFNLSLAYVADNFL